MTVSTVPTTNSSWAVSYFTISFLIKINVSDCSEITTAEGREGSDWLYALNKLFYIHIKLLKYLEYIIFFSKFLNFIQYPIKCNKCVYSKQIYVRATDTNRALESAEAMMAGIYPPSGDQIWNQDLLWQPISIHSQPSELDIVSNQSGHNLMN